MKKKWIQFITYGMLTCMVAFTMTGCFGKEDSNDEKNETTETKTSETSIEDDAGDVVDDAADAVDDAAEDVANGFDSYDDAHDYLIHRLNQDNDGADYEVKKKEQSVTEYKDGAKGYHYEIYDNEDSSGEKYGDFYVDKDNGKIYQKNKETNEIEEYKSDEE